MSCLYLARLSQVPQLQMICHAQTMYTGPTNIVYTYQAFQQAPETTSVVTCIQHLVNTLKFRSSQAQTQLLILVIVLIEPCL